MRILTFSDWRVQPITSLFEILEGVDDPVDLILYAGDDVDRFQEGDRNIFSELAMETRQKQVLAVHGNDDLPFSGVLEGDGVHDLHREPMVLDDYVFLGLEGAIEGGPGLILYSEEEIESHLYQQYSGFEDKIPVLLSHVPPHGILDIGVRFGQRHIGSTSVRSFIEDVNPIVTVCRHCHQFGGRAETGEFGTVINIASHDSPGAKGRYSILELEGSTLEYELTTTEEGVEHELLEFSQVGARRIQHFIDAGITKLEDIREENRATLEGFPGSSNWHVDMWLEEAEAIKNDELRVLDDQEFEFLKGENLILVDIETDLNQDHIWLIGIYNYHNNEFTQLFEKNDEEQLLQSFIEYLTKSDVPPIVYYGNNLFDETCLKRRMDHHGLGEGKQLMSDSHDLGIKVQTHLLGKFTRTNLASLSAEIADYEYKYPEIDGFIVGSKYTRYLLDGEEPDWNQLLEYNQDDVYALKSTVDTIRKILRS